MVTVTGGNHHTNLHTLSLHIGHTALAIGSKSWGAESSDMNMIPILGRMKRLLVFFFVFHFFYYFTEMLNTSFLPHLVEFRPSYLNQIMITLTVTLMRVRFWFWSFDLTLLRIGLQYHDATFPLGQTKRHSDLNVTHKVAVWNSELNKARGVWGKPRI